MNTENLEDIMEELTQKNEEIVEEPKLTRFEIEGKDGECLEFYHGFNIDKRDKIFNYYLQEKAFISVNIIEKSFNFGVEWGYHGKGYDTAIYNNYMNILKMLGVENADEYQLKIFGNPNHDFLKAMLTKKLVARATEEPNIEKALKLLQDLSIYPNSMDFKEMNAIIQYAINSNVPMEEIANAINENGFNISYSTINGIPNFNEESFEQFKSFGITGLKATCMHQHFTQRGNFKFMQLLGDVDEQDATLEFRRIFEEVKEEYKRKKKESSGYISPNLEYFGELEHIILDWRYAGLLFKNVSPNIRTIIKRQAISKFDEFDPEHKEDWNYYEVDYNSAITIQMLSDAGMMDKDAYIELYQKALNRNYNLDEFDRIVYSHIGSEERNQAIQEIAQNVYYPNPKGNWQKTRSWEESHKISRIQIPKELAKKRNIRDIIKQKIIEQGVAKKTKIKTDMQGKGKDGKIFTVDNLKDWMFGVPGAHGNLQITSDSKVIAFPPQTPKFAVEVIEQALNEIMHPDILERD